VLAVGGCLRPLPVGPITPIDPIDPIGPTTNVAPVSVIRCLTPNPAVGGATEFRGADSYDPDGQIDGYWWTFGDGSTSDEENPTHYYQSTYLYGEVPVTLTVTDNNGATTQSVEIISVGPIVGEARVSLKNLSREGLIYYVFHEVEVAIENVAAGPCRIYWGDTHTPDEGTVVKHRYTQPGQYTIRVCDANGKEVDTRGIYVDAGCLEFPQAEVSITQLSDGNVQIRVDNAKDMDILHDPVGGHPEIDRPWCQQCSVYPGPRGPANQYGICRIKLSIMKRNDATMEYNISYGEHTLDHFGNPVLVKSLPAGWYEITVTVIDDDDEKDCPDGRVVYYKLYFKVE